MRLHLHEDSPELFVVEAAQGRLQAGIRHIHHRLCYSMRTISFSRLHCPLNRSRALRRLTSSIALLADEGLTNRLKQSLHCCSIIIRWASVCYFFLRVLFSLIGFSAFLDLRGFHYF